MRSCPSHVVQCYILFSSLFSTSRLPFIQWRAERGGVRGDNAAVGVTPNQYGDGPTIPKLILNDKCEWCGYEKGIQSSNFTEVEGSGIRGGKSLHATAPIVCELS